MKSVRNLSIILILAVGFVIPAFSQEEGINELLDEFLYGNNPQDSILEAVLLNEADMSEITSALSISRFIYARSEFENKTYFMGQDLGVDQYNISTQVLYSGPRGLNIIISGLYYSGFEPKYNTTVATLGYNNNFPGSNSFRIRGSISRYFFSEIDSMEASDFNTSFNLGASFRKKHFGTSADIALLTGTDASFQASWDIFTNFTLFRLGLFSRLKFTPELSMYFGNKIVITNQLVTLPRHTYEIYSEDNNFGLLNTIVRIPLSFTYRNFDLVAGYNFNFPRSPGTDTTPDNTSFFNLSVGYLFNF
jgi:hypothetical protein